MVVWEIVELIWSSQNWHYLALIFPWNWLGVVGSCELSGLSHVLVCDVCHFFSRPLLLLCSNTYKWDIGSSMGMVVVELGVYSHYHFLATCFQTFFFPSPICIWSICTVMCHLGLSPTYRHKYLKSFDVYWCFCFGLIISASCCSFFYVWSFCKFFTCSVCLL
jgi:hypothetical protein